MDAAATRHLVRLHCPEFYVDVQFLHANGRWMAVATRVTCRRRIGPDHENADGIAIRSTDDVAGRHYALDALFLALDGLIDDPLDLAWLDLPELPGVDRLIGFRFDDDFGHTWVSSYGSRVTTRTMRAMKRGRPDAVRR